MQRIHREARSEPPAADQNPDVAARTAFDLRAHHQRVADFQLGKMLQEGPASSEADGVTELGSAIRVRGPAAFVRRVVDELGQIRATSTGGPVLRQLEELGKLKGLHVDITPAATAEDKATDPDHHRNASPARIGPRVAGRTPILEAGKGSSSRIDWNDEESHHSELKLDDKNAWIAMLEPSPDNPHCAPPFVALFHELLHALHNMQGRGLLWDLAKRSLLKQSDPVVGGRQLHDIYGTPMASETLEEEFATMGTGAYANERFTENALRRELGLLPRTSHFDTCTVAPKSDKPGG